MTVKILTYSISYNILEVQGNRSSSLLSINTISRRTIDKVNLYSKPYSTLAEKNIYSELEANFIEWFVGFTDGEGSFAFIKRKSRNSYVFSFRIFLHLDDIAVLFYIKEKLGLGRVSKQGDKACGYVIDKVDEIK